MKYSYPKLGLKGKTGFPKSLNCVWCEKTETFFSVGLVCFLNISPIYYLYFEIKYILFSLRKYWHSSSLKQFISALLLMQEVDKKLWTFSKEEKKNLSRYISEPSYAAWHSLIQRLLKLMTWLLLFSGGFGSIHLMAIKGTESPNVPHTEIWLLAKR